MARIEDFLTIDKWALMTGLSGPIHGIARGGYESLMKKLSLYNPLNINASNPDSFFGIAGSVNANFAGACLMLNSALTFLGSNQKDFGSDSLGSLLNPTDPNVTTNYEKIKKIRGKIFTSIGDLEGDQINRRSRASVPVKIQKINEIFSELLLSLQDSQFKNTEFKDLYQKVLNLYKIKNNPFQTDINNIVKKIAELLDKNSLSETDIASIKENLIKHFNLLERLIYGIHSHNTYNEWHLPPLIQAIEAVCFISDRPLDAYEALNVYKELKNIREILFSENNLQEEYFNQLSQEQKKSIKSFFDITSQELTYETYQQKISTFFTDLQKYIDNFLLKPQEDLKKLQQKLPDIDQFSTIKELTMSLSNDLLTKVEKLEQVAVIREILFSENNSQEEYFNQLSKDKKKVLKFFLT